MNLGAAMVGGNGKRREHDFYPTPVEATVALLRAVPDLPEVIWEPACGDGAISKVLKDNGKDVISTDLIERGYGTSGVDFLKSKKLADCVVTNPPFNLADDFIRHASRIGVNSMAMLLKVTYFSAAKRIELWHEWPPHKIMPLTWRLDFVGGGSPTMDCMWVYWCNPMPPDTVYLPLRRPNPPYTLAHLLD